MEIKRSTKDSVFTSLFREKKYVVELYNALFPESAGTVTEDDINIITLENILMNAMYNDLGFMVKDKLIVLAEAQSTWSENIAVRMLLYVANTYNTYIEEHKMNLYSTKNVVLPKPELFVIYSGDKKLNNDVISLSDIFFNGDKVIDLNIKVLTNGENNDIVYQYIRFTRVFNEQVKSCGYTKKAILETIRICRDEDILREFMLSREKEVVDMMSTLFNEETLMEAFVKEMQDEGRAEGRAEGSESSNLKAIKNLMVNLKLTFDQATNAIGLTPEEQARYRSLAGL